MKETSSEHNEAYLNSGDEIVVDFHLNIFDDKNEAAAATTTTVDAEQSFKEKLKTNYDDEVEKLADEVADLLACGSAFNCGLYQLISFAFISITWTIGTGWYAYVSVFTGYTPTTITCDFNAMNLSENTSDGECSAFDALNNETIKCSAWTYEQTQMRSSMITEYNLVCDRDYYFEMAYSIEQSGYVVGTLIFSYLADRLGRKRILMFVLVGMITLGFVQTYMKNFYAFFIIGFFINSLSCGVDAACITLILEMFTTSKRTMFGIGVELFWVLLMASLSPIAYLVKQWRQIRLIIFIVLSVPALFSFLCVQESFRWLISTNRIDRAIKIIDRVAKLNRLEGNKKNKMNYSVNRRRIELSLRELKEFNDEMKTTATAIKKKKEEEAAEAAAQTKTITTTKMMTMTTTASVNKKTENDRIVDIFKNKRFRLYVLIMALNWFATSLVYDGLTYLNNFVGENIFLNWVYMNLIELPAQFVCFVIISKRGRRFTVCSTMIIAGLALLLTCVCQLVEALNSISWLRTILFVLAKFSITQSYSAIILHSPELFPTNLRSFGYGISLFSGKLTSIISPFISLYLSKVQPILPSAIYGTISIVCGLCSLYVPETLNRPLPNSISDVVSWPRTLSDNERTEVNKVNREQFEFYYALKSKLFSLFRFKLNKNNLKTAASKLPLTETDSFPTLAASSLSTRLPAAAAAQKSSTTKSIQQDVVYKF